MNYVAMGAKPHLTMFSILLFIVVCIVVVIIYFSTAWIDYRFDNDKRVVSAICFVLLCIGLRFTLFNPLGFWVLKQASFYNKYVLEDVTIYRESLDEVKKHISDKALSQYVTYTVCDVEEDGEEYSDLRLIQFKLVKRWVIIKHTKEIDNPQDNSSTTGIATQSEVTK